MAKKRKQVRKTAPTSRRSKTSGVAGPELLIWALHGLQQEIDATRARLAELEAQARQLRSTSRGSSEAESAADEEDTPKTPARATKKRARKKRQLSDEARNRIAEAQKRRWAAYRQSK
jgi:hypothetical protein